MFARFRRRIGLVGTFAVFLVSGAHGTPANSASTDNCQLPQPRPHRREAIGSIVWICRVRSNAGTCGCSDNLSKKQVHGTGPRLLRTMPSSPQPSDCSARDRFPMRQLIRRPSTSNHRVLGHQGSRRYTGRERASASPLAGCREGRFNCWTAIEGQRGCANGRNLRANRTGRCFFTINRTDKGSKLQRASSRRSGGRAAPARSRRVARPGIRSPAGGSEQGRCERPKRRMVSPEADAAVNAGTESAASPGEGTSGTSRMGQLAVLIFLSFGLPGAGILAWVVMRADNTRGEQLAGTHFHATGADDRRPENKRRARGLDARREAARLDDFLAHLARTPHNRCAECGCRICRSRSAPCGCY